MSAEVETMFYTGEVPWHGLGNPVDGAITAEEAVKVAGLEWSVELKPVYFKDDNGLFIPMPESRATVRMDRNEPLGMVGTKYTPMQNKDAFAFFDEVVGNNQAKYTTAGSLRRGKKIWIQAEVGNSFHIAGGDDEVKKYVLLHNSHDGSSTLNMLLTPVRTVCQNTLNAAISQAIGQTVKLRHSLNITSKASMVREILGVVNDYYDAFQQQADLLAAKQVQSDKELQEYLDWIGLDVTDDDLENNTANVKARGEIIRLFDEGMGMDMTPHSYWNAVNAVAEFTDHYRSTRKTRSFDSIREARLDSQWFGEGARLKQRAWDTAMAMAV
jgi:phage/plasmid-like protein (TIGR03299 family)